MEYVIGLGETLFFDGAPGAAAAIFGAVLAGPDFLTPAARDGLLDWWASAIDRDARRQADIERRAMYQKILDRMEVEVGANPSSTAASYWLAAAARGQGDLTVAWDAALAGWVRAGLSLDENADLRGDIDRLVLRGDHPRSREGDGAAGRAPARRVGALQGALGEVGRPFQGRRAR